MSKTHLKIVAGIALAIFTSVAVHAQTLADGIRLTENEQYTSAKSVFKKLIAAEPTVGDNFFYFGDLLLKMDDMDSAQIVFQKGVDIEPSNPLTHVGLGRVFLYTGKVEEGLKELSQADALITAQTGKKGTITPQKQAVILCEMAETYTYGAAPNYDKAIDYTNRAEKQDATNPDVYLTRGDALLAKDPVNATPAIQQYVKAATLAPKSARANVRIGSVYMNGKNAPEAITYYNLALKSEPNYAPAYALKGEAWYQLGKFDSASANYSKYLALNPDCYARYRYSAFLYKSGDHDKAIEQGNQVITCDSNLVAVIYRIMAKSNLEKKTPDYAKTILFYDLFFKKQAITGRPKLSAEDYINRGKANAALKNDSLAIIDFRKAIKFDTAKKDVYFDLGNAYFKQKKYDSAAYWYKKKYMSEPNAPLATRVTSLNAYAKALYLNKEYSRADSAYTAVIGLDSTLTYGWLGRAQSNGKIDGPEGTKELARPYYERYFSIANADSVTQKKNSKDLINASLYLASVHARAKNYGCAKAYYELAHKLDPANVPANEGLANKDIKAATAVEIGTCVLPKK